MGTAKTQAGHNTPLMSADPQEAHISIYYTEYHNTHLTSFLLQGFQVEVRIRFSSGLGLRLGSGG